MVSKLCAAACLFIMTCFSAGLNYIILSFFAYALSTPPTSLSIFIVASSLAVAEVYYQVIRPAIIKNRFGKDEQ